MNEKEYEFDDIVDDPEYQLEEITDDDPVKKTDLTLIIHGAEESILRDHLQEFADTAGNVTFTLQPFTGIGEEKGNQLFAVVLTAIK